MTRQITINKNETDGFAARIQNRGQSNGTQTVELYKDGVLVTDEANLTLTPDEAAYVLEAPTVFSDASYRQTLTMEVVTENMTRTVEVYISGIPDSGGTHQWDHTEASGTDLADEIGSLTGAINGADWITNAAGSNNSHLDYVESNGDYTELPTDSQTEFDHYPNQATGTWFAWINPDSSSVNQVLFGNSTDSSTAGFAFIITSGGAWRVILTNGAGSVNTATGGSVDTSSWYPVAIVLDSGSATVYKGDPTNDYNLSSTSMGSLTSYSNGVATNVRFGSANDVGNALPYNGQMDISWTDNVARSQSSIQSFVDDSKSLY